MIKLKVNGEEVKFKTTIFPDKSSQIWKSDMKETKLPSYVKITFVWENNEALWGLFGGTVNALGYNELDSHIGCIYGDAITLERCKNICEQLKVKGFAQTEKGQELLTKFLGKKE